MKTYEHPFDLYDDIPNVPSNIFYFLKHLGIQKWHRPLTRTKSSTLRTTTLTIPYKGDNIQVYVFVDGEKIKSQDVLNVWKKKKKPVFSYHVDHFWTLHIIYEKRHFHIVYVDWKAIKKMREVHQIKFPANKIKRPDIQKRRKEEMRKYVHGDIDRLPD